MDLKGRVALITGGARIGRIVASALASRGCSLVLTYRDSREVADATAAAATAAGVKAMVLRADATVEPEIVAAIGEAVKSMGRIDILINMASISRKKRRTRTVRSGPPASMRMRRAHSFIRFMRRRL